MKKTISAGLLSLTLLASLSVPAAALDVEQARALLEEYYFSPQWLEDYTADEAGLLPPGLSRGVLAEDTIYNLITD